MGHGNSEAMLGNQNAVKQEKQSEKIHFSIALDEKAAWQRFAEQKGMTLAKFIKSCVNKEIGYDKKDNRDRGN